MSLPGQAQMRSSITCRPRISPLQRGAAVHLGSRAKGKVVPYLASRVKIIWVGRLLMVPEQELKHMNS